MENKIVLICSPLIYYSDLDETAFFQSLDKIKCIKSYKGFGRELHVYLKSKRISFKNYIELEGLFKRYFFDIEQLSFCKDYEPDEEYIKLRHFRNQLIKKNKRYNFLFHPNLGGDNF